MADLERDRKRADLLATTGAGVLGAGLALLLAAQLQPYAIPLLALGLATHGWGMYAKHRLEARSGTPQLPWAEWLYWDCWLALAALAIYIVAREF